MSSSAANRRLRSLGLNTQPSPRPRTLSSERFDLLSRRLAGTVSLSPKLEGKPSRPRRQELETREGQRTYLLELGRKFGIHQGQYERWYKVSYKDLIKHGGRPLLARHRNSPSRMLGELFPEHPWEAARFSRKPKGFWSSLENHRQLLSELGTKLGISGSNLEAWSSVTHDQLIKAGGYSILDHYDTSLSKMLRAVFPEIKWDEIRLKYKAQNYWDDPSIRKRFLENLGRTLGFSTMEDWYNLKARDLVANGGGGLLKFYDKSLVKLVINTFSDHSWDLGRFASAMPSMTRKRIAKTDQRPLGFWEDISNQRSFLFDLGRKLGIKDGNFEPWYKVSQATVAQNGGAALFRKRYRSMRDLLAAAFPEFNWDPTKFPRRSRNHWNVLENQQSFMRTLGTKLGFAEGDLNAWYRLKVENIAKAGGWRLLERYGGSPATLVQSTFPEHLWDLTKFPSHKLLGKSLNPRPSLGQSRETES